MRGSRPCVLAGKLKAVAYAIKLTIGYRPCSSSNKSSDTLFPDPEEGLCVDSDGCECTSDSVTYLVLTEGQITDRSINLSCLWRRSSSW